MAKETFYFSHDYNARSDKEMVKVRMKMGMAGIGLYWSIVEMLYEEGGYLNRSEYERISYELQSNYDDVTMLIEQFRLFQFDDEKFWSNSVLERLKKRKDKSDKARESINYRWNNTNVKRPNAERNTIKENKVNKSKGEESKEKVFPTHPIPSDMNGLPEIKIGSAIELIWHTKNLKITNDKVLGLWNVFKIQNLTGKKFYADESDVHSHFINWIKKQDFKKIESIIGSNNNPAEDEARRILKQINQK